MLSRKTSVEKKEEQQNSNRNIYPIFAAAGTISNTASEIVPVYRKF